MLCRNKMILACKPVQSNSGSHFMVTAESWCLYKDKIMVTKCIPTVEGISCEQHSGACPVSAHHLHPLLYYWALSVACAGCC